MSPDSLDPVGIYFGTRSGKLYASRDEGKSWKKILDGLPQILCVKAAIIQKDGVPTPKRYSEARPATKRKSAHALNAKRRNRR
ncbi:MAG: hypothetical protein WA542_03050 [Candidatus Acidiferrum sp.]